MSAGGTDAWTFAFEAYGQRSLQWEALRAAAGRVAMETPYPPDFPASLHLNLGYPEWLATVVPGRQPG